MAKLVTLKRREEEVIYPVTLTAAVMDSEGNPADVVFAKKNDSVSSKGSDQGVKVELGGTLASPTVKVNVTSSGITSSNSSVAIASDVFNYAAKNEVFKGAKAETSSSVAEAGKVGIVPAPASGVTTKYLKSDGTWSDVDAAKLGGLDSENFVRHIKGVQKNGTNDFPKYVLLAKLPVPTSETHDAVHISGSFGDYHAKNRNTINISVGRRGSLSAFGIYQKNYTLADLVVNESGELLLKCSYQYITYNFIITAQNATLYNTQNYTPLNTEFTYLYESQGVSRFSENGIIEKAKSDANGSEISTTYVKKTSTIKTTYDTDKGVKVELSGTFDEPKIDVTTTLGDVALSNSSNAVSGETIAKSVPLLNGVRGTKILANSDLNTIDFCENIGTYYITSDNETKTLTNCPTSSAFLMHVYAPLGLFSLTSTWACRVRKIIDIRGKEWIQEVYTGSTAVVHYTPWYRILREDTTFTSATTSTANGTQVVNAGLGGAVPAPQTLADNDKFLRGNGTWSAIPTSSVGSGITLPATGNAVHEALTGTAYINTISTDFIDNLFTAKG